jgi:proton glutamate symport protein
MGRIIRTLDNGATTLFAALCAVVVGFLFPETGESFKPFSEIFLTLISISVIPIIFSSITCSIAKILSGSNEDVKIIRIIFIFIMALAISAGIGMISEFILDSARYVENSDAVSRMIFQEMQKSVGELSIHESINDLQTFNFADFSTTLLPRNPYEAFAKGNIVQIIAISILVGIAISTMDSRKKDIALSSLEVLMSSFRTILTIPTKILPIGIFFLLGYNLSKINPDILISMSEFCLCAGMSFLIIILISGVIFTTYSPIGFKNSIICLKDAITVGFSTCSNQATVPFLISALSKNFKLPGDSVDLSIPLGITMCRVSNAAYYSLITVFIASIYNEPLTLVQYVFIIFGSVLTSFAASGSSGIIAISMLSIILDPLNLPGDPILILLVIIDPIIDPFRTITSLITNAALSCLIINKRRGRLSCA